MLFLLFGVFQLQDVTQYEKIYHFIWLTKLFMIKSTAFFSIDQEDVLSMQFGILVLALFLFLFYFQFLFWGRLFCGIGVFNSVVQLETRVFFMIASIIFISTQKLSNCYQCCQICLFISNSATFYVYLRTFNLCNFKNLTSAGFIICFELVNNLL